MDLELGEEEKVIIPTLKYVRPYARLCSFIVEKH